MNLDIYNTHMELYPYIKDDFPIIEKDFTAIDKFSGNEVPCGYIIDDGKLFLPRGAHVAKIERLCELKGNYINESDPYEKMNKKHFPIVEPRDDLQRQGISFLKESLHQQSLTFRTGFGKAQPLCTKIPTPDGYKLMGDIKVGDNVFDHSGRPTKVIGVYPQGVKDVYEITFSDGRKARCCKEHLWEVSHPWSPRRFVASTEDIMKNYRVYRPRMMERNRIPFEYRYRVPLLSDPVGYDHRRIYVHPYVIGALIGNGCLREKQLSISSGDDYVPIKIAGICGFTVKKLCKNNHTYAFYNKNGSVVHTSEFLKSVPQLIESYSYDKIIPEEYMYNSLEVRMELLRGLMDTDGSISDNDSRFNVSYSSTSKMLLKQIQELIRGLGYIANIGSPDKRVDKYTNGHFAIIQIRVPNRFKQELFTHPKKHKLAIQASWRGDYKQPFTHLFIRSIELVGSEECQCIMVENDRHLYITEDFVVTHNTFTVAYAATELDIRTLIITPNEKLKQQWIATFYKMMDFRPKDLMNIAGSSIMDGIMEDLYDPCDVYFVNHQTLRSYMSSNNGYMLHKFFKKLNIGIKVYDESHLEFANIILTDFYSNTDRTWYLTATFSRSDKTEAACFKRAFNSVEEFGYVQSTLEVVKHVIYHVVKINSHISPKDRSVAIPFNGMTSVSYGKYAFFRDNNQTAYNTILKVLHVLDNVEGKILIFIPLIDAVDDVTKKLKTDYPDKSVAAYHSRISAEDKRSAEKKDIIVTTIKSYGTGADLKGLRAVMCCEPIASKVIAEQLMGRIRPYTMMGDNGEEVIKDTYFFDIVDVSIPPCNFWHRARFKKYEVLSKEVVYLDMDK